MMAYGQSREIVQPDRGKEPPATGPNYQGGNGDKNQGGENTGAKQEAIPSVSTSLVLRRIDGGAG